MTAKGAGYEPLQGKMGKKMH